MKNNLWIVIIVVAGFLGFLTGYSVQPLIEVGMLGGHGEPGLQSEVDQEMDEYYDKLQE